MDTTEETFTTEILIDDPITGELIDPENVDQMIDRLEAIQLKSSLYYAVTMRLRRAIAAKTEGDTVTRRIAGANRKAKIIMPDESFEQSILKELWNSHPILAAEYLKIERLAVKLREYKKLLTTSSDQADFLFFKEALIRANVGRVGTPRIEIER